MEQRVTSAGDEEARPQVEESIAACYSTWAGDYFDKYYGEAAAYPPVHADLILDELRAAGTKRMLDAGCGPASFLRHIASEPIEWHGFDVTPEMVDEARRSADALGRPQSEVWLGSVLDDAAFVSPSGVSGFDAAVLVGVLPHIPRSEDQAVLRRLKSAVRPGGLLVAEARNALFGLFTLNRYSAALFSEILIDWDGLRRHLGPDQDRVASEIRHEIEQRFRMDLPRVRAGQSGELGYDQVLSRTHVPFELARSAREAGWLDIRLRYVHHHAAPPMFEHLGPEAFRRASLEAEDPDDWKGVVRASSFLVFGRRG
jgi:SAM-dependent methyltransferase